MCGTRGHDFPPAVDMMERIVLAEADDMAAGASETSQLSLLNPPVSGSMSMQPEQTGQGADAVERGVVGHGSLQAEAASAWMAPAEIRRSAMMAMAAIEEPATRPRPVSALVSAI
jgi:hypothetical protein